MFKPKPDIKLTVDTSLQKNHTLGWFRSRQYLGTVKVPNKRLVGGYRVCDLYVEMASRMQYADTVWIPLMYAVSPTDFRTVDMNMSLSDFEWDWRQAVRTAQELVRTGWWDILRKDPLTP